MPVREEGGREVDGVLESRPLPLGYWEEERTRDENTSDQGRQVKVTSLTKPSASRETDFKE